MAGLTRAAALRWASAPPPQQQQRHRHDEQQRQQRQHHDEQQQQQQAEGWPRPAVGRGDGSGGRGGARRGRAARMLTAKERRFWQYAMPQAPLGAHFDAAPASALVLELQEEVRRLYVDGEGGAADESALWTQVGLLVRQLQEARAVVRRLVAAEGPARSVSPTKRAGKLAFAPERTDAGSAAAPAPDPALQPPSPVRSALPSAAFCASNVGATLAAMARHKDNAKIQEHGCRAVLELIRDDKRRRERAGRLPLAGAWACGSCQFPNEPTEPRCRICSMPQQAGSPLPAAATRAPVLAGVASDNEQQQQQQQQQEQQQQSLGCEPDMSAQPLTSAQVEQGGGVQLIVDAMRIFRGHQRVQRAASFALAQLVHDRADCVEDIASAGGVVEVLETMQAAPQDAELQAQCLGVLASPALAKDSVVRIEGDLFARVVCAALRLHHDQARLQALGCLALANLAIKSDRFAAMLTQQHHAHLLVMEAVQHQQRALAAKRLAASGATPTATALLAVEAAAAGGDPRVAAASLWALVALARARADGSDAEVREAIKAAGGVHLAVAVMAAFPGNRSVIDNGRALFKRLGVSALRDSDGGSTHAAHDEPWPGHGDLGAQPGCAIQ